MAQIQNFGFIAPVQKSYLQHPPRPGGGVGKQRRKPKGSQYAVCPAYHSGTHGQGFGGYVSFGYDYQQFADRTVPAVQISPPEGTGTAEHQLFRCVGGYLCQEDYRL